MSYINLKIGQKMTCLWTKLNFLANGCDLGQNARKETPFKIQFYCQDNIHLLSASFLNLINGIGLFFCLISTLYACLLVICSPIFKLLYNSLNFEAKINCNTIKPNVPKWRKTCTGLKFALLHFYGPQSHILSGDTFEGPCSSTPIIRICFFPSSFWCQQICQMPKCHKSYFWWCLENVLIIFFLFYGS